MRLIDADALKEAFKKKCCCEISLDLIDNAPTVEERPQGDLNNAIKTIKAVCEEYNTCVECPMNRNCNEHPATWTEAEGGAENE